MGSINIKKNKMKSKKTNPISRQKEIDDNNHNETTSTFIDNRSDFVVQRNIQNTINNNQQKQPIQFGGDTIFNPSKKPDIDFKNYLRERAIRERVRQRAENARLITDFEYRYYTRTFKQGDAIIAKIIDKSLNLPRADYGVDLMFSSIKKMKGIEVPLDITIEDLIHTDNPFKTAALDAYNKAVRETSGKTDTQLGLRANYVDYK